MEDFLTFGDGGHESHPKEPGPKSAGAIDSDWLVAEFAHLVMEFATRDKGRALAAQLEEFRQALGQVLDNFTRSMPQARHHYDVIERLEALSQQTTKRVESNSRIEESIKDLLTRLTSRLTAVDQSCQMTKENVEKIMNELAKERENRPLPAAVSSTDIEDINGRIDTLIANDKKIIDFLEPQLELPTVKPPLLQPDDIPPVQPASENTASSPDTGPTTDSTPTKPANWKSALTEFNGIKRFAAAGLAVLFINAAMTGFLLYRNVIAAPSGTSTVTVPPSTALPSEPPKTSQPTGGAEVTPPAASASIKPPTTKSILNAKILEAKVSVGACQDSPTLAACLESLHIPVDSKEGLQKAIVPDCAKTPPTSDACNKEIQARRAVAIAVLQALEQQAEGTSIVIDGKAGTATLGSLKSLKDCARTSGHYVNAVKTNALPNAPILAQLVAEVADLCGRQGR